MLDQTKINILHLRLRAAQFAYFSLDSSPWTDREFDYMLHDLKQLAPDHPFLNRVGSREIVTGPAEEARLPISMGSLDKLRPGELKKWVRSLPKEHHVRPFVVMPKIDGMSLLIVYDETGKLYKIYTRGDGVTGRDVTKLLRNNTSIPKFIPIRDRFSYVRGEFVLQKDHFRQMQRAAELHADEKANDKLTKYRNARNMLMGCLNTKTQNTVHREAIRFAVFYAFDLQFEAHSTTRPSATIPMGASSVRADKAPKSVRLNFLSKSGFTVPERMFASSEHVKIWKGKVRQYIKKSRDTLPYDIDGVVITSDAENAAKLGYEANGLNPKWERAVKLDLKDQNSQTVEVGNILWSVTPRGLYKPVLRLKYDATFNGVRVRNVYVDNAGYVKAQKLGPGAVVTVVRSGDVIPRIVRVETPSTEKGHFPKKCKKHGEKLLWTPTKTDLFCPICAGVMNSPADFFKVLNPENIGHTLVAKACDLLKVDNITQLFDHMDSLEGMEGFGRKRARMFKASLTDAIAGASMAKLMHASGAFRSVTIGLGEARISSILDFVTIAKAFKFARAGNFKELAFRAQEPEGIGKQAADCFARQLPNFLELWDKIAPLATRAKKDMENDGTTGILKGKRYAFTNFRSKMLETLITDNGGTVTNTINEKLTALFIPSKQATSVKIEKARKLGVRMIPSERAQPYLEKRIGTKHKTEVKAGRPEYKFKKDKRKK